MSDPVSSPPRRGDGSAIRLAAHADRPLLAQIEDRADALFRMAGLDLPALPEPNSSPAAILVVGAPPVGFVRVDELDGAAHVQALAVVPGSMRRGLGGALLAAACDWARAAGYDAVTLTTFADVPWNRRFYERHGFGVTEEFGPEVAARRAVERDAGLDAVGDRVVMRREL